MEGSLICTGAELYGLFHSYEKHSWSVEQMGQGLSIAMIQSRTLANNGRNEWFVTQLMGREIFGITVERNKSVKMSRQMAI